MLVECLRANYDWQMRAKETRRQSCIAIDAGIYTEKNRMRVEVEFFMQRTHIYLRFRLPPILLTHYYTKLLCEAEQKRLSAMPTKSEAQTNDRMWFGSA